MYLKRWARVAWKPRRENRRTRTPGSGTGSCAGTRRSDTVHADGTSTLVVADTPWAMPWRARLADVEVYARRRAQQGFNAAPLMTLQPDLKAVDPGSRDTTSDSRSASKTCQMGI